MVNNRQIYVIPSVLWYCWPVM